MKRLSLFSGIYAVILLFCSWAPAMALQGSPLTFDCAGTVATFGAGISDAGKVVGWYTGTDGATHGFLLEKKDGACTTIDYPGAAATFAFGINDPEQITGVYLSGDNIHGFVYEKGTFTSIDYPLPGVCQTYALGENNRGQIVGFYDTSTDCDGPDIPYLRESDGTFTTLSHPEDWLDSVQVNDINSRGDMVGAFLRVGDQHEVGFYRDKEGNFTTFEPEGAVTTMPTGINARGEVVGRFFTETYLDPVGPCHGFYRNVDGTMTEISYPGASYTCPSSINAAGEVSGYWSDGVEWHGFVANKGELMP